MKLNFFCRAATIFLFASISNAADFNSAFPFPELEAVVKDETSTPEILKVELDKLSSEDLESLHSKIFPGVRIPYKKNKENYRIYLLAVLKKEKLAIYFEKMNDFSYKGTHLNINL